MVSVRDIGVLFGNFVLMKDISFLVNPQDRIGLAGRNGAGKSTLLKIMAGHQQPTNGNVEIPGEVTIGYLPQQMKVSNTTSVIEETLTAFAPLLELERQIGECRVQIAEREDYEAQEYLNLCDRLNLLEERYSILGGDDYLADAEKALTGLGFERKDFTKPTAQLSGGWRMRIELAKVLLGRPSLLLLDEPTNHLDIESIRWLEQFLKSFPGAVILVSHDKAFLDNITTRTLEISAGKLYDYKVPYTQYLTLRRERREQLDAAYKNQRKTIEDTERFIERFRYKASKAVQVQSRIKQLDKIVRIEPDDDDAPSMDIRFAPAPRAGTVVVEAERFSKAYGSHVVLENTGIIIERGEKVAFVGRNGEGKTTFAKVILGELDFTGIVKKGHNVHIGYFAQNQDELLDEEKTIFHTIDEVATGDIRTKIRDILGAFLFSGEDIDKKVKVLSGGERSRLALVKLLLEPYNLLLLDEPTNHLDMRSKEILKRALLKYDGTLIIVSHDRDFLDGLITKVYEFRGRKIRQHIGGIYEFLRKREIADNLIIKQGTASGKTLSGNSSRQEATGKQRYIERKDYARSLKRLEKRVEESEARIESLEVTIADMDTILQNPVTPPDNEFFAKYRELKESLAIEMTLWEEAHNELGTFISEYKL
jgi:ATP-binding cassette subfamily F protein 3